MAQHSRSSHVSSSAGEYVTNWSSVVMALMIVGLLTTVFAAPLMLGTSDKADAQRRARAAKFATLQSERIAAIARAHQAPPLDEIEQIDNVLQTSASMAQPAKAMSVVVGTFWAVYDTTVCVNGLRSATAKEIFVDFVFDAASQQHVTSEPIDEPRDLLIGSDTALYEYLRREVTEISLDVEPKDARIALDVQPITSVNTHHDDEMVARLLSRPTVQEIEHPHLAFLERLQKERPELAGLPLRDAAECTTDPEISQKSQVLALALRREVRLGTHEVPSNLLWHPLCETGRPTPRVEELSKEFTRQLFANSRNKLESELTSAYCASVFEQILQVERYEFRLGLVDSLSKIPGPEATAALTRRALFDVDANVRHAARAALTQRAPREILPTLRAFEKYPLAPIQVRAKNALAELTDKPVAAGREANATFARHVSTTFRGADGQWMVNELVKVNHLRNCLMCHPQSFNQHDTLRAQIPKPGQRLPQVYYGHSRGDFVRTDVVYLKPDFSLPLAVEEAAPWPTMQRFDFFVRTRPATAGELDSLDDERDQARIDIAQRIISAVHNAVEHAQGEATQFTEMLIAARW